MFIEQEGGIKIEPMEVNLENLDSIERILRFVDSHSS
jgi:acyl carrier protein